MFFVVALLGVIAFGGIVIYRLKIDMEEERAFRAKLNGLALGDQIISPR